MTDEALLQLARDGHEEAFAELYGRFRDPLFRFAWRLTGSVDRAEDLVHDGFLVLWRRPLSFRPDRGSLRMFLFGIVRNLAYRTLRDARREEAAAILPEVSVSAEQFDCFSAEEMAEALRASVASLPLLYREVLLLADFEGLPMEEIAKIVQAGEGTVRVRLHRARAQVKQRLAAASRMGTRS